MEINNRIFKVILTLIIILVSVGYSLVFSLKLDEPVFFQHYYDQWVYVDSEYYDDITFNLGYVTNASDSSVVIDIEFPEYPEIKTQASEYGHRSPLNWGSEQNKMPGVIYGQYNVRSVNCKITYWPKGKDLNEIVLTQARVLFDDSSEMTVFIGEIHINEYIAVKNPLYRLSSSWSSDGTAQTRYRIREQITIAAFDSPLIKKFEDRIHHKINDRNPDVSVGMIFQEGNFLDVTSKVRVVEDIVSEYTLFNIHPKLLLLMIMMKYIIH